MSQYTYSSDYSHQTHSCSLPGAPLMSVSASIGGNDSAQTASSDGSFFATSPDSKDLAKSSLPSAGNDQLNRQPQLSFNYAENSYQQDTREPPRYNGKDLEQSAALFSASSPGSTCQQDGKPSIFRYPCLMSGCESSFSRSMDLNRHYNSVHFPQTSRIDCPKYRCTRKGENGFPRSDHLKEHLRQYHGETLPKALPPKAGKKGLNS